MTAINYFNIYSINFSKINDFKIATSSFTDELQPEFQKAIDATTIREGIEKGKGVVETVSRSLAGRSDADKEKPGYKMFEEMISHVTKSSQSAQAVLDQFQGTDPYEIQELVHVILGISIAPTKTTISDAIRQNYFLAMKACGFLSTTYSSVNTKDEKSIPHQPGALAAQYLTAHPEIKTLTIACGEARKTYPGSCEFRRNADHARESFTIDLSMKMGPHVPANMHDLEFWKSISNERFEHVLDHSNSYFLLEDSNSAETLKHVYRTLQPGGCLKMDCPFRENHTILLRNAGFFIEEGQQRIAKKLAEKAG